MFCTLETENDRREFDEQGKPVVVYARQRMKRHADMFAELAQHRENPAKYKKPEKVDDAVWGRILDFAQDESFMQGVKTVRGPARSASIFLSLKWLLMILMLVGRPTVLIGARVPPSPPSNDTHHHHSPPPLTAAAVARVHAVYVHHFRCRTCCSSICSRAPR